MNKCKTCKWWEDSNKCSKLLNSNLHHISIGLDMKLLTPEALMRDEALDYKLLIRTKENFGCVLWEGKDGVS